MLFISTEIAIKKMEKETTSRCKIKNLKQSKKIREEPLVLSELVLALKLMFIRLISIKKSSFYFYTLLVM